MINKPIRNATRTTIAPTGSLSLIAGCSSGIEPIFALVEKRSNMSGALEGIELNSVYPLLLEALKENGNIGAGEIDAHDYMDIESKIKLLPQNVRKVFVTSHEIDYEWHVKMQAVFQWHCNNAVSKTINMSNSATVEDVKNAYIMAWKKKCKGITVYRDGSREKQVLNNDAINLKAKEEYRTTVNDTSHTSHRDRKMEGPTIRESTVCGYIYVTVNRKVGETRKDKVREVFAQLGKSGGCASSHLEAISRLVSTSLKGGIDIHDVIRQLRGIRCGSVTFGKEGQRIVSCADAIAKVLLEEIGETSTYKNFDDQDLAKYKTPISGTNGGVCPECGSGLSNEEGCSKCHECGYAKC